jgi:uracil-DNA glycosylase family 4
MEGFFTSKEVQSVSRPDGKLLTCISCGLYQHCQSPRMKPYGNFKKGILNIGEFLSDADDKNNKPFQGKIGQLIQRTYRKLGIDLFEDCLNINSVRCYSEKDPSNYQIECCRRMVMKTIEEYKPKVIILLGQNAVYSLIGNRWKKDLGSINKWRGWTIPDQDLKTWVCPVFNPEYIERALEKDNKCVEEVVWSNDLKQAFSLIETTTYRDDVFLSHPFPVYKEPIIHITDNFSFLDKIKNEIAFDFETTGLKCQGAGHRIVCCSVAISEDEVYVFMMPKTPKERKPFIDMLQDESIKKIAQNMKFEFVWSQVRLGVEVKGWIWDTMLLSHILDNREGITNLAFQTYVNFGIIDFKDDTQKFLEADKKNANSLNTIFELLKIPGGTEKILHRCALDSIFEYRLKKKQEMELLPF